MTKNSYQNLTERKKRNERTILNRWGEIKDIYGPIKFLLSDESSYITGASIPVDGGWLIKGL